MIAHRRFALTVRRSLQAQKGRFLANPQLFCWGPKTPSPTIQNIFLQITVQLVIQVIPTIKDPYLVRDSGTYTYRESTEEVRAR